MLPLRSTIAALAALAAVLAGCAQAIAPPAGAPRASGAPSNPLAAPASPALTSPRAPAVTPSTAAASPPLAPGSSYLSRSGSQLLLNGKPYRVVGIDAYELATDWGANYGCGGKLDDAALDGFLAGLPPNVTVRIWGFQGSMATNPNTGARDWSGLDRVVAAAARHGQHLIVSLGNQSGDCDDGHWKDPAWYRGGYRTVYPGDGRTVATTSYWDWVHEIVSRYRDSTAIASWELINEPEASECTAGSMSACYGHLVCPDEASAAAALRSFVDTVGGEIKRIDSHHLVGSGALGGDQCGWAGTDYAMVHASLGVDLASYHDYAADQVVPGELAARAAQMNAVNKPLIVGEVGVQAGDGIAGCRSLADRQSLVQAKATGMLAAGVAGVLVWDWVPNPNSTTCTLDVGAGDPLMGLLGTR